MENSGSIKTSISLPVNLWNDIQDYINSEEMTLSRFIQSSTRLKLKSMKIQNVREVIDLLSKEELEILKSELKKKSRK